MTDNWYRDMRDLQHNDRGDPNDCDPDDHDRKFLLVVSSIISGMQRGKIDHLMSTTSGTRRN